MGFSSPLCHRYIWIALGVCVLAIDWWPIVLSLIQSILLKPLMTLHMVSGHAYCMDIKQPAANDNVSLHFNYWPCPHIFLTSVTSLRWQKKHYSRYVSITLFFSLMSPILPLLEPHPLVLHYMLQGRYSCNSVFLWVVICLLLSLKSKTCLFSHQRTSTLTKRVIARWPAPTGLPFPFVIFEVGVHFHGWMSTLSHWQKCSFVFSPRKGVHSICGYCGFHCRWRQWKE